MTDDLSRLREERDRAVAHYRQLGEQGKTAAERGPALRAVDEANARVKAARLRAVIAETTGGGDA